MENAAFLDPFDPINPERAICDMNELFKCNELETCFLSC